VNWIGTEGAKSIAAALEKNYTLMSIDLGGERLLIDYLRE
jgi:hypothetical protein